MSKRTRLDEDPAEGSRSVVDHDLKKSPAKPGPEADAKGQSEKNHKGGQSDGVSSANPRVISGEEDGDATFHMSERSRTSL
ncbi:hypothetical protein LB542_04990 [Mesorhizobium sp. BR1-1-9]|uniref:hypothetical protein n=1 Tax=Mesorhizobium sp. BR1-1-9 TaxID=2876646 RepID=UPI001CD17F3D|nr:hypothetical protein [Mesorhizobium sp. BR1-1-9]MBZ9870220.1 hypothetical protein [Mesorhizobium sp. BR1-1-9]